MLTRAMRSTCFFQEAFIGNEEMLKDKGARELEVTQIQAAEDFLHMIDEALAVSGTVWEDHRATRPWQDW